MKYSLTNRAQKILWVLVAVVTLVQAASTRQTMYVMDVTMHGSTYPQYASNPEYDITKNSYPKTGDIAPDGIKEMYKLGQQFRSDYITRGGFMSPNYDSDSVFLESVKDQPGLMSAYAFMLGAYPDSVSYLNLNMNNAREHQKLVRQTLGLSDAPNLRGGNIQVSTDEGFMYWSNPSQQCPAMYKNVLKSLRSAEESADDDYRSDLFPQLASTFGRSRNKITFESAYKYLDDYLVAKRLGKKYPKFSDQASIDRLIEDYERDYFYEGLVGGSEIPRVVATPLINYAMLNTYEKSQETQGRIRDSQIHQLKHSHFFANEMAFAAFLKALGKPQSEAPQGGENFRVELFETNNQHFVSVSLNGKPMNLAGSNHGIFELDDFLKNIYPKMYFGDIDDVCVGREEISLNVFPKCQDYMDYLGTYIKSSVYTETKKVKKCHLSRKAVTEVVAPPAITTRVKPIEKPVRVGFVEIVQSAPQRPKVDLKVVEIDRPVAYAVPVVEERIVVKEIEKPVRVNVPVVEEKIVVQEVEKLIQEKPTHIHHINLKEPEEPVVIAPTNFAQEEEPSSAWPWWLLLIPLLCLIPCLAFLCCRRKKVEPVTRPKQPMAPVLRKPVEKEIMHIKTEERNSPERKFVIEKKVVDEAAEIEQEITRELRKSRAVRESRAVRDVSRGRQTTLEIAAEAAMSRGSGGGRRKRIKTIKKFGEVIGKEIQYLDNDGNVIRTERVGVDEGDARSERFASGTRAIGKTEVVSSNSARYLRSSGGGGQTYKESYGAEERLGDNLVSSSNLVANRASRASRRGYSSGRHMDTAGYVSGSNAGLVDEDRDDGRYSPGGTRRSRGSAGRAQIERVASAGRGSGSGAYRKSRIRVGSGGTGKHSEYREERITKGGTTKHQEFYAEDDDQI